MTLVALLAILATIQVLRYRLHTSILEATSILFIIFFIYIWISIEVFSIFGIINSTSVIISWCLALLVAAGFLFAAKKTPQSSKEKESIKPVIGWNQLSFEERALAVILLITLAVTLFTGLIKPPNTLDGMTYHMARVAAWIQQGSVDHLFTSIARQNYSMPLPEYAITHLNLLSGIDRFAHLVAWFAYLVNLVIVALITRDLGGSSRACFWAATLTALIPMALLQASTVQTDLVVSAFCLAFAWGLVRLANSHSWSIVLFCGAALGLALLSKGTAYIYCAAIGLSFGWTGLSQQKHTGQKQRWLLSLLALVLVAGVINLPHLARNYQTYGHAFSTEVSQEQINHDLSVSAVAANIVKNASLHLGTPIAPLHQAIESTVKKLLGPHADARGENLLNKPFYIPFKHGEDYAGNPLHLLLILVCLLALPWSPGRNNPWILACVSSLGLSVLLFAALLPWQPWGSRLQLPNFIFAMPLCVLVLSGMTHKARLTGKVLTAAMVIYALPLILFNPSAAFFPFTGTASTFSMSPEQRLFQYRRGFDFAGQTIAASDIAAESSPEIIGFELGFDDYEYALRKLMDSRLAPNTPDYFHLRDPLHRGMTNPKLPRAPDVVFSTLPSPSLVHAGRDYELIYESRAFKVLRPAR